MKNKNYSKVSENDITNQIIDGLHLNGYICKKIYNGGVPARAFQNKIIYKTKPPEYKGVPDLIAINTKKKKLLFIEVKKKGNYPSLEQKEFINMIKSIETVRGVVAYGFEDIDELV